VKKVVKSISLLCILSLLLVACANKAPNGGASNLEEHFQNFQELQNRASNIIQVTVIDNIETINYGEVTFTVSKAKVLSGFEGTLKVGDEIILLETGGMMNNGQELKFNGIPVIKPGEELFLFVDKYVGPVTKDAYIPIGVYQGKFKVKDNKVEQQAPNEDKLKDYQPVTRDLFKEKLKNKG
jgi:hypothetical protein